MVCLFQLSRNLEESSVGVSLSPCVMQLNCCVGGIKLLHHSSSSINYRSLQAMTYQLETILLADNNDSLLRVNTEAMIQFCQTYMDI